MTRAEQELFVRNLTSSVADSVTRDIRDGLVPEEWNGHQLRRLLADIFDRETTRMTRSEVRRFNVVCATNDLGRAIR